MNCNDIENLLYDYVTERLDGAELKAVEAHLKTCEICKVTLSMVQKTIPLLDHWTPPTLPSDFSDQVLERIYTDEKTLWQKIIDKIFFPIHIKVPLEALAVSALAFLVIVVYRGGPAPEVEKISREITIETQIVKARRPITIETKHIDSTSAKLLELIKANNGHIVRRKPVDGGIEVTISIEQDREKTLLQGLTQLGKVEMEKEGHKDGDGNIVIILRKR